MQSQLLQFARVGVELVDLRELRPELGVRRLEAVEELEVHGRLLGHGRVPTGRNRVELGQQVVVLHAAVHGRLDVVGERLKHVGRELLGQRGVIGRVGRDGQRGRRHD